MKITKADFKKFVDFTANLDEDKINPFIDKAFERDVMPKIGPVLAAKIIGYTPDVTVTNTAEVDDVNNTFSPLVIENTSADEKLFNAVKPYWVYAAYTRHTLKHGIDHTPVGFVNVKGNPNFEPISDKRRAEMMKQDESDMNFYEGEMMKFVKAAYLDLFKTDKCTPARRKNSTGIYVAKIIPR